jgi:hypothetical protein
MATMTFHYGFIFFNVSVRERRWKLTLEFDRQCLVLKMLRNRVASIPWIEGVCWCHMSYTNVDTDTILTHEVMFNHFYYGLYVYVSIFLACIVFYI